MWNAFQVFSLGALLTNLVLGVLVYLMNPGRRANRFFLIVTLAVSSWVGCLTMGAVTADKAVLMLWMRLGGVSSVVAVIAFDLLRYAIVNPEEEWRRLVRETVPWVVVLACAAAVSLAPTFVIDVEFGKGGFPTPVYGKAAQALYMAVFLVTLGLLTWRFRRDMRRAEGIQRVELEFAILASAAGALAGLALAQVLPWLTGNPNVMQFLPLCVILYGGILAYGIVTQRIMNVGDVLRRATAYGLLAGYLVTVYVAVQVAAGFVLRDVFPAAHQDSLRNALAALAVAFSVAPMHGRVQRVASRLFINIRGLDPQDTLGRAQELLMSIGTTDELMQRFAQFASEATGTDRLCILVRHDHGFQQAYPQNPAEPSPEFPENDSLALMLQAQGSPVTAYGIRRQRPTPLRSEGARTLGRFQAAAAIGMYVKERLEGMLLLGRRLSGKIYDAGDLQALQILCNQLGVALENAKLYTAVQDSKIYNDILLDALVSGVIAVNADRRITVFNHSAQTITGQARDQVLEAPVGRLPAPLADVAQTTLDTLQGVRDQDVNLVGTSGEEIPIRLSSSIFHSHVGEVLGALLVINNLTTLRKLEEQIRRSDRLSSIGTLAAGMAHEIKNPLVSIKTFTQLLPTQYDDSDFRNTFATLIPKEVRRIDSLVTRLLHFARPRKATLAPLHLGRVLDDSLNLLDQQLRKKGVTLHKTFEAGRDLIEGDMDLLSQAFVNFFLNAIEAMHGGGHLTVTTATLPGPAAWMADPPDAGNHDRRIMVAIQDTGDGIPPDQVQQVFDPFFSTKTGGTGLGLAVAHGIVEEHGATIDVESRIKEGTTFSLYFDLIEEEQTA